MVFIHEFVLFINDLPTCLKNCSINMFADDTIIYVEDYSSASVSATLQKDLDRVAQWTTENNLILNTSTED